MKEILLDGSSWLKREHEDIVGGIQVCKSRITIRRKNPSATTLPRHKNDIVEDRLSRIECYNYDQISALVEFSHSKLSSRTAL